MSASSHACARPGVWIDWAGWLRFFAPPTRADRCLSKCAAQEPIKPGETAAKPSKGPPTPQTPQNRPPHLALVRQRAHAGVVVVARVGGRAWTGGGGGCSWMVNQCGCFEFRRLPRAPSTAAARPGVIRDPAATRAARGRREGRAPNETETSARKAPQAPLAPAAALALPATTGLGRKRAAVPSHPPRKPKPFRKPNKRGESPSPPPPHPRR